MNNDAVRLKLVGFCEAPLLQFFQYYFCNYDNVVLHEQIFLRKNYELLKNES